MSPAAMATSQTRACRPTQNTSRWTVERTHVWHTLGFWKLAECTECRPVVIKALIALANAIIVTRRLIRKAWATHRWDTRPKHRPRPNGANSKRAAQPSHAAEGTASIRIRDGQAGLPLTDVWTDWPRACTVQAATNDACKS